jgi:hypothetical protein
MEFMFAMGGLDDKFNNTGSAGIGNWNTSQVTKMNNMFESEKYFNQNLRNWNIAKVTNRVGMFSNAQRFTAYNSPLFPSSLPA